MNISVGTCGRCGGRVSVPAVFMGIVPPTPRCEQCAAVPVEAHGPVLPMQGGTGHAPSTIKVRPNTGES